MFEGSPEKFTRRRQIPRCLWVAFFAQDIFFIINPLGASFLLFALLRPKMAEGASAVMRDGHLKVRVETGRE